MSTGSAMKGLARMLNPLIHGLNEEPLLPQYIVLVPDVDIIKYLKNAFDGQSTSAMVMGAAIHYIIRQMDIITDRRKQDLGSKRLGSLPSPGYPKFIWICMLKHPTSMRKGVFNLCGKFNSILEERLLDGNLAAHCIMSIEVPPEEFYFAGNLTSNGKATFWREVNQGLKKFHTGEITLHPRTNQNANTSVNQSKAKKEPETKQHQPLSEVRIPTKRKRSRSKSRSRSRRKSQQRERSHHHHKKSRSRSRSHAYWENSHRTHRGEDHRCHHHHHRC